jgi:hypothetical protein
MQSPPHPIPFPSTSRNRPADALEVLGREVAVLDGLEALLGRRGRID